VLPTTAPSGAPTAPTSSTAAGAGGGELPDNGIGTSSSNNSSNGDRWWLWWLLGFLAAVVLLGLVVALVWARKERRRKATFVAALSGAVLSSTRDTYQNATYEELGVAAANGSSAPPMYQEVMPLAAGSGGGASLYGNAAGDDAVVFYDNAAGANGDPLYDNSAEDKHTPPLPRRGRESEMQWRGVSMSPEGSPSRETTL
jgi:hypothetical protein